MPEPANAPAVLDGDAYGGSLEVGADQLALVQIRYKEPGATADTESLQVNTAIPTTAVAESFDEASDAMKFAAAIAAFAEILKESPFAQPDHFAAISAIIAETTGGDVHREEFSAKLAGNPVPVVSSSYSLFHSLF